MVEKERKFLPKPGMLKGQLDRNRIPQIIQQGYLMVEDHQHLRVRVVNDTQAFLCMKVGRGIERQEFEYEIPLKDGKEMLANSLYKLTKTRVSLKHKSNHIDIDYYSNGLVVIEIEFKNDLGPDDIPEYCGEEISGKKEYSNIYLAQKFSRDLSKLRKEDFFRP